MLEQNLGFMRDVKIDVMYRRKLKGGVEIRYGSGRSRIRLRTSRFPFVVSGASCLLVASETAKGHGSTSMAHNVSPPLAYPQSSPIAILQAQQALRGILTTPVVHVRKPPKSLSLTLPTGFLGWTQCVDPGLAWNSAAASPMAFVALRRW